MNLQENTCSWMVCKYTMLACWHTSPERGPSCHKRCKNAILPQGMQVLLTRNTIALQCIALATSRWRTTGASTRRWHMSAPLTVYPGTPTTTHPLCPLARPTAQPAQPTAGLTRLLTGLSEMSVAYPLSSALSLGGDGVSAITMCPKRAATMNRELLVLAQCCVQ